MIDSIRDDELGDSRNNNRDGTPKKLDLYSIPVFLLEIILLAGLGYSAFYVHYQYNYEPAVGGLYCDDIAYRQRQITALCKCCTLHSITRRTLRFSAAYLLGFLVVMISCDILAHSTGRLRPYFAQDCPRAYNECPTTSYQHRLPTSQLEFSRQNSSPIPTPSPQHLDFTISTSNPLMLTTHTTNNSSFVIPSQATPIESSSLSSIISPPSNPISSPQMSSPPQSGRILHKRAAIGGGAAAAPETPVLVERFWIDLNLQNLLEICSKIKEAEENRDLSSKSRDRLQQIAMSWPSFPAAIFTYAILFTCCYLSFVGTARPFRLITCILVMLLLLVNTTFNVQLIKQHYNHWEDVVGSTLLSLIVVLFILHVYLNKFRDSHYYENQKLIKQKRSIHENIRGYSNDVAMGEFTNLDKIDHIDANGSTNDIRSSSLQNGDVVGGSGNDVAMRYFQIPRANYRGAPRPLSSLNQML